MKEDFYGSRTYGGYILCQDLTKFLEKKYNSVYVAVPTDELSTGWAWLTSITVFRKCLLLNKMFTDPKVIGKEEINSFELYDILKNTPKTFPLVLSINGNLLAITDFRYWRFKDNSGMGLFLGTQNLVKYVEY